MLGLSRYPDVLRDPVDEVILEGPLDQLVEQVGGKQLVDVGTGEIVGERLVMMRASACETERRRRTEGTFTSPITPKTSHNSS